MQDSLGCKKQMSEEHFYRLRRAGIFVGETPSDAHTRCELYERYLKRHLKG